MQVSGTCLRGTGRLLAALAAATWLAGCGAGAPHTEQRSRHTPPYLPRANVTGISGAAVRLAPAPRAGGRSDVRGVTPRQLLAGGGRVLSVSDHGVLTTSDGGQTWRHGSLTTLDGEPVAIGSETSAAPDTRPGKCGLRVTRTGGAPRRRPLPDCETDRLVAFADQTHLIAVKNGYGCGLADAKPTRTRAYVSADGARTWQRGGLVPGGLGQGSGVAAGGRLYVIAGFCEFETGGRAGNGPTVVLSRDGGRHWAGWRLPGSVLGCDASVAAGSIWLLCQQVVYRSADAGRTWRAHVFADQGPTVTPWRLAAVDGQTALATPAQGGAVLRTTDGGGHWTQTWPRVGPCELGSARVRARTARDPRNVAATLDCLGLPRRLAPAGAQASAWQVNARTFIVTWTVLKQSGYTVWQRRAGRWRRLLERSGGPDDEAAVGFDDVNGDRRLDALIQGESGSGGCGVRDVIAIGTARVTPLFHRRDECEQYSELRDGLLRYRKAIGPCPDADRGAHCYGGVRTIVRGWSGRRVVVNRTFVRCLRADLDPHDHCRRR